MWVFTIPMINNRGLTIYRQVKIYDKNSYGNLTEILFKLNLEATVYEVTDNKKEKDNE